MTDDLVKRLRDVQENWPWCEIELEAADRIETLEKKIKLLEQSQAAYALAGLGVDVMAAHNAGLEGLKAGCKEERLRAEKAEKRIETLEAALRELDSMVSALDAGELELYQVGDFIDAALAGEKKDD